jgi:hypothetical protein
MHIGYRQQNKKNMLNNIVTKRLFLRNNQMPREKLAFIQKFENMLLNYKNTFSKFYQTIAILLTKLEIRDEGV